METRKVTMNKEIESTPALAKRVAARLMLAEDFVERHASGTLRKNKRLGMSWRTQYLHERVVYEFGYGFECLARSRVMFGDAFTLADCGPLTEAGWLCERHIEMSIFPEDRYEVKYITIEEDGGKRREGVGLILRETSASFVPDGHIVFAIVTEFDVAKDEYLPAVNPS